MSVPRLARAAGHGRPAAPVRLLHLGLGSFFRAHQCWYTEHAGDATGWGMAAFGGRGTSPVIERLKEQDGLYTLVTRGGACDGFEVVGSISRAHGAAEHEAWLGYFEAPELAAVTITITEAGYRRRAGGGLDLSQPDVQADLGALHRDPRALVRTAPARLLAGIIARRRADGGPLSIVPCDNVSGNGAMVERVLRDAAELLDPAAAAWIAGSISFVTTIVDRITPRTAAQDVRTVLDSNGWDDRCPVVTEPFHEWVLSGEFPASRPRWEDAGAIFTADIAPYDQRKLWLLNGGHSLLAYAGSIRGNETVAAALSDETCRHWLEQWWSEASAHLAQPAAEVGAYRAALLERFANPRMHHRLEQIAADGSQKLPIRILPVLRAERAAARLPQGATRVLAAWVCHLRGAGVPVADVRADELRPLAAGPLTEAIPRTLEALDPVVAADAAVVAVVIDQCRELEGRGC